MRHKLLILWFISMILFSGCFGHAECKEGDRVVFKGDDCSVTETGSIHCQDQNGGLNIITPRETVVCKVWDD